MQLNKMKKHIFKKTCLILTFLIAGTLYSQENLYLQIKEQVKVQHPGLHTANKLMIVNVWSVNDAQSRQANIQINKAIAVYEGAKLKGGPRGVAGVLLCKDEDSQMATIALGKDEISKAKTLHMKSHLALDQISNIIFDANGNEVARNIQPENIYDTIHQLITR
jgi:hypothetical protein